VGKDHGQAGGEEDGRSHRPRVAEADVAFLIVQHTIHIGASLCSTIWRCLDPECLHTLCSMK
jgi:hypothetical protein